jgi:transcriptional regulator with XRE-family HTH domain
MSAEIALLSAKEQITHDIAVKMAEKGLNTSDLAKMLKIKNVSYISQAIHGNSNPRDIKLRKKIYKKLGMI